FSFETWINPSVSGVPQKIFDISNAVPGSNVPNNNIMLYRNVGSIGLQVLNGSSGSGAAVQANNALTTNEWQHIVVTLTSAGVATIYRNGVALASGTVSIPNNVIRTNAFIGRSYFSTDSYFGGRFDEMAFYDKSLSATSIANRYALSLKEATLNRND